MKLGDVIDGKYELVRELGKGGMGAVFEGRHIQIGRRTALKFPEVSRDPHIVSRFLREAQAAAAIGSDHIVDVYDVGQLPDGAPYLVMEFLEGLPLSDVIRRTGQFETNVAVGITLQLCDALAPAHDRGIVHRDIKPANLFLTTLAGREGWLKVLDFGIAKVRGAVSSQTQDHLTRTGMTLGTPYYMAPEQFMGAKDVDGRADVYSASVILYQMLSGSTPFTGASYEELIVRVAAGSPPSPVSLRPDLDGTLAEVVLRAMARDEDERYPSMEAFAKALRPFANQAQGASIPLTLVMPAGESPSSPQRLPSHMETPLTGFTPPESVLTPPETAYTPSEGPLTPPETAYTPSGLSPQTAGPTDPRIVSPTVQGPLPTQKDALVPSSTPTAWESEAAGPASSRRWLGLAIGAVVTVAVVAAGVVIALNNSGEETPSQPISTEEQDTPGEGPVAAVAGSQNTDEPPPLNRWVRIEPALPDTLLGLPVEMTDSEDIGFRTTRRITAPTYAYEIQQHEVTWQELRPWLAEHP